MLCLSRYRDESIIIGDDIIVTVIDIRGDRVRLGITAPADVPVNREEIYCRVLNKTGRRRIGPRPVPPPARPETAPRD